MCLPAQNSTFGRSINRWQADRRLHFICLQFYIQSPPLSTLLCALGFWPVLTYHWDSLPPGYQLIFSRRNKGRSLEGARRAILKYLFPWCPICRDSESWLFPLTKGLSSFHRVALSTKSFSSDSSNCLLPSPQRMLKGSHCKQLWSSVLSLLVPCFAHIESPMTVLNYTNLSVPSVSSWILSTMNRVFDHWNPWCYGILFLKLRYVYIWWCFQFFNAFISHLITVYVNKYTTKKNSYCLFISCQALH